MIGAAAHAAVRAAAACVILVTVFGADDAAAAHAVIGRVPAGIHAARYVGENPWPAAAR